MEGTGLAGLHQMALVHELVVLDLMGENDESFSYTKEFGTYLVTESVSGYLEENRALTKDKLNERKLTIQSFTSHDNNFLAIEDFFCQD